MSNNDRIPFNSKTPLTTWTYNPQEIIDGLKKENKGLKDKVESLEKLLQEYADLYEGDNFNYIDGHCCYREVTNVVFDSVEMKPDYSGLYFNMKCDIVYKDIETHETIATRKIKEGIGEDSKCIEI